MNQVTPTRRALADLPVNTLGTPPAFGSIEKPNTNNKRPIETTTDPEYLQPLSRLKCSPNRPQNHLRDKTPPGGTISAALPRTTPSNRSARSNTMVDCLEPLDEVGDGDSQNSYTSAADFDPDETMVSQQTAATELSQPLQSRASQHAETLRLRLRLAHFKVKTNQTNVPLSQLRVAADQSSYPSGSQEISPPRLLPAPILKPSTTSPRAIQADIPSSPPSSPCINSEDDVDDKAFRTPALPRQSKIARPETSPLDAHRQGPKQISREDESLTSSAVRGNAAIGLLGLRQER